MDNSEGRMKKHRKIADGTALRRSPFSICMENKKWGRIKEKWGIVDNCGEKSENGG